MNTEVWVWTLCVCVDTVCVYKYCVGMNTEVWVWTLCVYKYCVGMNTEVWVWTLCVCVCKHCVGMNSSVDNPGHIMNKPVAHALDLL